MISKRLKQIGLGLLVFFILHKIIYYVASYDNYRLSVGLSPRFSTTFGVQVYDGGTLTYWGIGYTIVNYRRLISENVKNDSKPKYIHLEGPQTWYWLPWMNFPLPSDHFRFE